MTTAPEPDRPSALNRATDGVGDRGAFDVRTWRDEYGPRGEAGLWSAGVLVAALDPSTLASQPAGRSEGVKDAPVRARRGAGAAGPP